MNTLNLIPSDTFVIPNDPTQIFMTTGHADQTIMIPDGLAAFGIGSMLTIVHKGSGKLSVAAAGNAVVSGSPTTHFLRRDTVIQFLNIGTDTWLLAVGPAAPVGL